MNQQSTTDSLRSSSEGPNNVELPPAREAVIEQAQRVHQEVAHERDLLRLTVSELRTEIEGLKAVIEVHEVSQTQMESRVRTATLERDRAVADRAAFETLFSLQLAQLRTFKLPNIPLIRDRTEDPDASPDDSPTHTPTPRSG
jgi:hypothetical protein